MKRDECANTLPPSPRYIALFSVTALQATGMTVATFRASHVQLDKVAALHVPRTLIAKRQALWRAYTAEHGKGRGENEEEEG